MQPPAEKSPRRVFSLPSLIVILLGAIAVAVMLLPNPTGVHARIEKGKQCARITPVLAEAHFEDGRTPAEALLALPTDRLNALEHLTQLPPQEQLNWIFNTPGAVKYDAFAHAFTLSAVRNLGVVPPGEAFMIIGPKSREIPDKQRLEVFSVLVSNSLAYSKPDLAAEILRQSCRTSASSWETVTDMVRASRASGTQAHAFEELRKWLAVRASHLTPAQQVAAGILRYDLALEANLPAEALDQCIADLNRQSAITAIPAALLERTHRAAVLADRTKEILPWVESYLASFPEAALSWQDLVNGKASDSYKLWVKRAADIADGNLLADKAYAHHQRLAAMGDTAGLDRLLPLSTHLGRGEETAQVMQAIGRRPGNEKLSLQSARIIAFNGKPDQAAGMFEEWIAEHPADRDAAFELASMKETTSGIAAAIAEFEKFLRAFPADAEAVKKLAALRIRNGQPQSALREFDNLREADFDAKTLDSYTHLAESLDRPDSLQRALRITSDDATRATPAHFIRMAEIAQQQQDAEAPLMVLREGIKRLPQSPSLRVKLAELLIEQENFEDALTEALHPVVKSRLDALSLALAAGVHTSRAAAALAAVGPDFETRFELSTSVRLNLAAACCIAGETKRGQDLFASVRPDRESFARLAEAHLLAGHADQAEIFARQNVVQSSAPKPSDWILLGDAQATQGRKVEANDAYAKALSVVSQKIAKGNATEPAAAEVVTILPAAQP